jgi:hypothetical protein
MERGEGKNMRIMTTFKKPTLERPPSPAPLRGSPPQGHMQLQEVPFYSDTICVV